MHMDEKQQCCIQLVQHHYPPLTILSSAAPEKKVCCCWQRLYDSSVNEAGTRDGPALSEGTPQVQDSNMLFSLQIHELDVQIATTVQFNTP